MTDAQLKAKLESALHRPAGKIWAPIWKRLLRDEGRHYLSRWEKGIATKGDWNELKGLAKEKLELQEEIELGLSGDYLEESVELVDENIFSNQTHEVRTSLEGLSNRTKARARAFSELSALVSGVHHEVAQTSPVKSKVQMRQDHVGAPGRWVALLEVDAWVPPEDVERIYRNIRRSFLHEEDNRTAEGTFELARFVGEEQRLNFGARPKWPVLFRRWNEQHPDRRFKTFNGFRQCCLRGIEATIPHYKLSPDIPPPTGEDTQRIRGRDERIIAMLDRLIEARGDAPLFE